MSALLQASAVAVPAMQGVLNLEFGPRLPACWTILCASAGLSNTGIPQVQQELDTELDDVRSEASLSRQATDTAPHFFWTQILQTLEGIARPAAAESIGPRHAGQSSVSSSRCASAAFMFPGAAQ